MFNQKEYMREYDAKRAGASMSKERRAYKQQYDRDRHRRYMNEWRRLKGEGYRTRYRIGQLRRAYGLTEAAFLALVEKQKNACAACFTLFAPKGPAKLTVDHDHITNRVRGLLCDPCNRTIGHAKEEPSRLRACAVYLEDRK